MTRGVSRTSKHSARELAHAHACTRRGTLKFAGIAALLCALVFMSLALVGCTSNQETQTIEKLEDLQGKTCGTLEGCLVNDNPELYVGSDGTINNYKTMSDCVAALENGKIDALVYDEIILLKLQKANSNLKMLDGQFEDVNACFVFQKGNERTSAIREEINEYVAKIKADGTVDELVDKWCEPEAETYSVDYDGLEGENGTISVAVASSVGLPSITYQNGKFAGFDIEVFVGFCKEYGYKPEFSDMDFGSIITAVSVGKCDIGAACISYTEERAQAVDFSDSYCDFGECALVCSGEQESTGFFESIANSFTKTFITENRWKMFVQGALSTLLISLCSILFGTILGFLLFFLTRRGGRICRSLLNACIWLVESLPVVVFLMVLFYIVFGSANIDGAVVATIGFTFIFAASVIGMLRLGVNAIDEGQYEAGLALGYESTRVFFSIVFPQALKIVMPKYTSEAVNLLKGTAVVGYIAVQDLTKMGDIIRNVTFEALFPLFAVALIYILLELGLRFVGQVVERCLNKRTTAKSAYFRAVDLPDYSKTNPMTAKKLFEQRFTKDKGSGLEPSAPILEFDHIGKRFKDCEPLTNITASVNAGEVVSLIGASGCGKSTLMRCINLLDPATSGTVQLEGTDVSTLAASEVRKQVGMVFQRWNLFGHWTILENIVRPQIDLLHLTKQEACERAMISLAVYGLSDKAFAYPEELSGGQQQRIAIIRSFLIMPAVLLMDEPTSALDPAMVREVEWNINLFAETGMAFFIVSHDMEFIRRVSTRTFFLSEGVIYEEGTPAEIFKAPELPATRAFVYQLSNFDYTFKDSFANYYTFLSKLAEYCAGLRLDKTRQHYLENYLEEMCLSILDSCLSGAYSVRIRIEYANKNESIRVFVEYDGEAQDVLKTADQLPMALISHETNNVEYKSLSDDESGYTNRISATIKTKGAE